MHYSTAVLISIALTGTPLFGQGGGSEYQAAQSLLSEVRNLREELRTAIVTTQRMQIILYRLQVQETVVSRASQKLEEIRAQLAQLEQSRKSMAPLAQQLEEQLSETQEQNARKTIETQLARFKSMLEGWNDLIPTLQAKENEALGQLQNEQAKQAELQDSLDRIDKLLEASRQSR